MKKFLLIVCSLAIISAALTSCAMDKKDTTTTNDQTLTPTTDMSQKVSEELTDMSEDVSEALTDASEKIADNTTTMQETTK